MAMQIQRARCANPSGKGYSQIFLWQQLLSSLILVPCGSEGKGISERRSEMATGFSGFPENGASRYIHSQREYMKLP